MTRGTGFAAITACAIALGTGCVTSATEVLVHIDTDAPPNRPLSISVTVRRQNAPAMSGSHHSWTRGGDGGITLPASFAIVPAPGERDDDTVTLALTATFGVGNGQPSATIVRTATVAFEPRRTVPLSIFLASSCALVTTGCHTPGVSCTVSQRCMEMNMTCGDMGICVPIGVNPSDGGIDASASDVPHDGCSPDCTGRMCGLDPRCGVSCGACNTGMVCAPSGQCVLAVSCGDHTCSTGESCANCPGDCPCPSGQMCDTSGSCVTAPHCGDTACNNGETCATCPGDCPCGAGQTCDGSGNCVQAIRCGDGVCNGSETCASCATDCGCTGSQVCSNGSCCTPNCAGMNCGPDGCGGTCGTCSSGLSCAGGNCAAVCGDTMCAPGIEDCGTCPADCPCPTSQVCFNRACCMPNCSGRTCGDDGCGGTCGTCPLNQTCDSSGNCSCSNLQCGSTCCGPTACACGCTDPNRCCGPAACASQPDCQC